MLQVRAEAAESIIKKFRRNACNGERVHASMRNISRKVEKMKKPQSWLR